MAQMGLQIVSNEDQVKRPGRITVMQSGGLLTDMQLVSHNETFHAHKLIVATASNYLTNIFKYEQYKESEGNVFTIMMNDVQPIDVANILKYIYIGQVRIRKSETDGFLRAARILRIDRILTHNRSAHKVLEKDYIQTTTQRVERNHQKLVEDSKSPVNPKISGKGDKIFDGKKKASKSNGITEDFKRPLPLAGSSKGNSKITSDRVASLLKTTGPRPPTPHPKTDTEIKAKVFYVTPLVKKLQWTIPEGSSNSKSVSGPKHVRASLQTQSNRTFDTVHLTGIGSSQFSSISESGIGTQHVAQSSLSSYDKDIIYKMRPKKKFNKKLIEKIEILSQSGVIVIPEGEKISKKHNNSCTCEASNSKTSASTDNMDGKKEKPNLQLGKSVYPKNCCRAARNAFLRRQLKGDVSDIGQCIVDSD